MSDSRKGETYMSRYCATYDATMETERRKRARRRQSAMTLSLDVMLNRRMPNGTYGGVRGGRESPLLDSIVLFSVVLQDFSEKLTDFFENRTRRALFSLGERKDLINLTG